MFWSEVALALSLLCLCNSRTVESAASLAVLGVWLDGVSGHWLYPFIFARLVWYGVFAVLMEIVHAKHVSTSQLRREQWRHLEKLREQKNLQSLMLLMAQKPQQNIDSTLMLNK